MTSILFAAGLAMVVAVLLTAVVTVVFSRLGMGQSIRDEAPASHRHFGADVVWAIEDRRYSSARLERDLLGLGQKVVRVPPKLMAQTRASARTRAKSDPIRRVGGRSWLREPDLPVGLP